MAFRLNPPLSVGQYNFFQIDPKTVSRIFTDILHFFLSIPIILSCTNIIPSSYKTFPSSIVQQYTHKHINVGFRN